MMICEIGLNHMGDINYANEYVNKIIKAKADGVLFHIREKEFYQKKGMSKFQLPKEFYFRAAKKLKKNKLKFGITLADPKKITFCKQIGVDFYKIFGKDILYFDLIEKMIKTKKKIFVSTSMSDVNEINRFTKFAKKSKQFTLIHTQLDNNIDVVNLRAISMLKKKFGMNVAYGNHCENLNVLYLALCFEPSDLLFYVKGNRKKKHADELHAYELNNISDLIVNLRELSRSLGKEIKIKMNARRTSLEIIKKNIK